MTMQEMIAQLRAEVTGQKPVQLMKSADPLLTSVMSSTSLKRELANRFIDLVVAESVLLQAIRVHRTDAPAGDMARLNITSHITEGASENADSGNTSRPVDSSISFATVKLRSALDLSGEWQEDNIEGPRGVSSVVRMFGKQISNDMETLAIEGDDSVSGSTAYDRLVKTNDGFHVLTAAGTGAHIVDAAGKKPSYKLMSAMLRAMPTKWKNVRTGLRWFMSWDAAQALVDEVADRTTVAGDQMRAAGTLPPYLGIPVVIVPKIPEDLSLVGTSGTTGTFIWLTDPMNFIWVVQRALTMNWFYNGRYDRDELTIFTRSDFLVENTDRVVKATDVSVWTGNTYYGA